MKTAKAIQTIGIAALAYLAFTQLGTWLGGKISVGAIRLQLGSITPTGQNLTLYIPVKNNAPVSYPLEGFQGQLFWGENPLAAVQISDPVTIAGQSTTEIPVGVFIPFAQLGPQLVQIITAGNWLAGAKVKGNLRAGGLNVPISQPIQIL